MHPTIHRYFDNVKWPEVSQFIRMAIKLNYLYGKGQNGECNARMLDIFFYRMSSDNWILVVHIPSQILLTILFSVDQSARCKLNVYIITHTKKLLIFSTKLVMQWKSKEWGKSELECVLLILIYSNSKHLMSFVKHTLWTQIQGGLIPIETVKNFYHNIWCFVRENIQTEWLPWILYYVSAIVRLTSITFWVSGYIGGTGTGLLFKNDTFVLRALSKNRTTV